MASRSLFPMAFIFLSSLSLSKIMNMQQQKNRLYIKEKKITLCIFMHSFRNEISHFVEKFARRKIFPSFPSFAPGQENGLTGLPSLKFLIRAESIHFCTGIRLRRMPMTTLKEGLIVIYGVKPLCPGHRI